ASSSKIKTDVAGTMASAIVTQLTSAEKAVVAGSFAKAVEGAEVVELPAVSSTSVMVNACYDLLSESATVVQRFMEFNTKKAVTHCGGET
ncbi:MAG: P44/Msp2 family outer membrane protein, partial [Anaplasma sp.]